MRFKLFVLILLAAVGVFGQTPPADSSTESYQVGFLESRNFHQSDPVAGITNIGTGDMCVNIYATNVGYNPTLEIHDVDSCCSVLVKQNEAYLVDGQELYDSIVNWDPSRHYNYPTTISVNMVATAPQANGQCDAASSSTDRLTTGLRSSVNGIAMQPSPVNDATRTKLTKACAAIRKNLADQTIFIGSICPAPKQIQATDSAHPLSAPLLQPFFL